jgi:DnaK suppressor protein
MSSVTIAHPGVAVWVGEDDPPGPAGASPVATVPQQSLQVAAVRQRAELESRWRSRLESVTELSLAYHEAAQQASQAAPPARLRAARRARQLARRTVTERQALAEIEAALDRIASGQYGRCEQCREPLSAALLARQPQARYCTACACLALQPGT